jgi:hypothetical protein
LKERVIVLSAKAHQLFQATLLQTNVERNELPNEYKVQPLFDISGPKQNNVTVVEPL